MISETRKAVSNFDTETKIRLLVALINDEGKEKLKSSIDKLITRFNENIKNNSQFISKYLIKSITFLPQKTPIYAMILSLLYTNEKELVEEVINRIIEHLHTPFDSLSIPSRLINFLFECYNVNIIKLTLIKTLIKYLLQSLSSNEYPDQRKLDLYLYILISNLPYISDKLNKDDSDFLLDLLGLIEDYFKSSNKKLNFNQIISSDKKGLNNYWEIVFNFLKENKFSSELFIRPFPEYEEIFSQRKQENLYCPKIKFFINLEVKFTFIKHVESSMWFGLNIFDETSTDTVVPEKIDRYILQEKIEEIVEAFEDNIEICVKYLLNLNKFYEIHYDLNFVLVETIFSLMLRLPKSKAKVIFYSSLLVNLCRKTANDKKDFNIVDIVHNAIEILFSKMEEVDIECNERLTSFYSFFLSNFQFNLESEKFNEILSLPKTSMKTVFFRNLVEKMTSLADRSKIMSIVSNECLHAFFPKEDKPNWKFNDPNETFYYDSQVVCDNIMAKKEYNTWVDKFDSSGNEFVYIFMSSIFYCKSKTLSHLRESITLYKDAISTILTTKEQQFIGLEALIDVWGHSCVYLSFIFDLILKFSFVDCMVAVKWIFDKIGTNTSMIPLQYNLFNLMNTIVNNCSNSILRIQKELSKEQENMAKSEESFQTNIIKNIETYEETLDKYFEIERRVYHEIVFKFIILYSTLKSKNSDSFILDHVYNRLVQFVRNYKCFIVKNIGKINEFYQKYEDKQERITEIINNLVYF